MAGCSLSVILAERVFPVGDTLGIRYTAPRICVSKVLAFLLVFHLKFVSVARARSGSLGTTTCIKEITSIFLPIQPSTSRFACTHTSIFSRNAFCPFSF